jgi:hypothetical protein
VRRRLVGDQVEGLSTTRKLRDHVGGVAENANGQSATFARSRSYPCERVVQRVGSLVEVARLEPAPNPFGIDLDAEDRGTRQGAGKRLRAAHPAQAGRKDRSAREISRPEVFLSGRGKRLVRPLENPLRADVDPASGRHLAEHRQPESLQSAELIPRRPPRHEQRIGD